MQRVLVYDRGDEPLFELSPLEVYGLNRKEAINGEHSLSIRTTQVLQSGQRVLTLDNRGIWREHVVYGTDESHKSGSNPIGEYYCVWSLMHDLMGTTVSRMVGVQSPVLAEVALEAALSGTSRWTVGTVTNPTLAGASMYDMSGWEAMQVLTKNWGGEIDVTIEVGLDKVVARRVDYYDAQGEQDAKRRFDFGADLKGVRRKVPDGPIFCRISPRGKGEQTEGGGYGRKITIKSVNGGNDWLQNDSLAQVVRLPDGHGGWEYPTRIVENSQIDTPSALKAWGLSVLNDYTVPKVSYEVDAVQAAIEGVSVQGVSLGDAVQVVDAKFNGLRIGARVTSVETDMLDELSVKVKLGHIGENIGSTITQLKGSMASVNAAVNAIRSGTELTDSYMQRLVARLNEEINATGGYWYLIEGLGTRTYDVAVSDPSVGAEASKVIEMKGGSLRIADSKNAQGEWEWDTVFVSGHIASQLVTAAQITTGYIGSPNGNYWNLDTGEFKMMASSMLGSKTVQQVLNDVDSTITGVDVEYASNTSAVNPPQTGWSTTAPQWQAGHYIWSRTATTTAGSATPEYSTPVMISGRDGTDGTDGTNGVGISSTTVTYGVSTSAATQPSSWSSTAPTTIPQGRWLWTKTVYAYTDGSTSNPSYSKSYMGTDGSDGTSVTIKGSYDTYQQLIAAHPTGSSGDAYMVGTDLYVWNGTAWEDVGQIQGPQGPAGQNGTSVTVTSIQYGVSNSASTQPSSWSTTAPTSIAEGKWLWVKTTYSDGSNATTKSYVGTDGADGTSVYITSTSKVGDTTTVHFSDGSTITVKDGEDGTNGVAGASGYVHTAWANSANGVTDFSTSVSANKKYLGVYTDHTAADSTNPSSYSWSLIKGADGQNGQNGLDGETAYVHTAWANSADGTTDFSTSVSAGKSYLGIYSDFIEADSTNPTSYSWSKIEGEQGTDGTGVTQIVEQYYLSTSSSTTSGGSWVTTPPTWSTGKYYWTRSQVTWTDGTTTYTTPVLSRGLNSANSTANTAKSTADTAQATANSASTAASNAAKVATDYLTFTAANGLEMGYSGTSAKTRINTSGLEVFDGDGNSVLLASLQSGKSVVRIGKETGAGNVVMNSDGSVDVRSSSSVAAHFGWGKVYAYTTAAVDGCYYDLGIRKSGTQIGMYSLVQGDGNTASGVNSFSSGRNTQATKESAHAEGQDTKATGNYSHAEGLGAKASGDEAHAEGQLTTASGGGSHAEGLNTTASADASHAGGWQTVAASFAQTAIGYYNISSNYQNNDDRYRSFIIGNGGSDRRSNSLYVTRAGNLWIAGTLTQNSDRRLKEHHAYLSDDACDFIRQLKPALYTKDGERHTGFYAQDVQDAEPDGWDTATVTAEHTNEGLDFDPLTLDYTALIAPLVAYCQHLERRIEAIEKEAK